MAENFSRTQNRKLVNCIYLFQRHGHDNPTSRKSPIEEDKELRKPQWKGDLVFV